MEEIIPKSETVGEYEEFKRRRLRLEKIFLSIIAVLVLIIILGSTGGYKLHLNFLDKGIKKIDSLQNELNIRGIVYQENYEKSIDSISKIDELEDVHKKGFIKFKTKDDETQKNLDSINNINASFAKLDSIAKNKLINIF